MEKERAPLLGLRPTVDSRSEGMTAQPHNAAHEVSETTADTPRREAG
jgi:hypothetical protein